MVKKLENDTTTKGKSFLEEDITDTCLEHFMKEFNKKEIPAQSLIYSSNEEILENAPVTSTDKITKKKDDSIYQPQKEFHLEEREFLNGLVTLGGKYWHWFICAIKL